MLNLAVHCAETALQGAKVIGVLADGSEAIRIGIEDKSAARIREGLSGIFLRRCFANDIRTGGTRGVCYRGGMGSLALARYLLQIGVPPKLMAKMMSIIILFNYLPSNEVCEEAMKLFCFNTTMSSTSMRRTFLQTHLIQGNWGAKHAVSKERLQATMVGRDGEAMSEKHFVD